MQKQLRRKKLFFVDVLKVTDENSGSGSASRSMSQRYGSADPDPHQKNFMDPQHTLVPGVLAENSRIRICIHETDVPMDPRIRIRIHTTISWIRNTLEPGVLYRYSPKIAGSGSASMRQRYGSADSDLHQKFHGSATHTGAWSTRRK
jgi:hypothetical protein